MNGAAHANERRVNEDGGAVLRHKQSKNKNLQETAKVKAEVKKLD